MSLQIERAHSSPKNEMKESHTSMAFEEIKDKEKILKASRERKRQVTFNETMPSKL